AAAVKFLMQYLQMRGVDGILHRLEPIAVEARMDDDFAMPVAAKERIVVRQNRGGQRPEVRPDEVQMLLDGIRRLLHSLMEIAAGGLRRTFEALPFKVVEPAVIRAGDAALLDAAVGKRGAAVRAAVGEQPEAPALRAEKHQIFP